MTSLPSLALDGNKLTHFPQIVKFTPHLHALFLSSNDISKIENNEVTYIASLTYLHLSNNDFKTFPIAVNKFRNLKTLSVFANDIASINDNDFVGLHQLRAIYLSVNPIVQIGSNSLKNTPLLERIYLLNTKITQIPEAVMVLRHLSYLSLFRLQTECSSSKMFYLKPWNVTGIFISYACCSSVKDVEKYLKDSFPKCP